MRTNGSEAEGFNRYIVECKYNTQVTFTGIYTDLIDT